MGRLFRNKRWEGVNGLSGRDSKHGSTKTRNVERYGLLTGLFLSSTWSAFSYIRNREVVETVTVVMW